MMEKPLDILDLGDELRALVAACEVSGGRTLFQRGERVVAALVSWDEYLALRETIDVSNDPALREAIAAGDAEAARGAVILVEELFEE